ncbi:MAG TPA: dihydrolipoamide acetyltransferase family protein [Micromonospora sp.]
MRHEFMLPDLGEGLAEAEIRNWLVAIGDTVTEDQALVEVETAKAVVEIPSPVTGTLVEVGGDPGTVLPVGALLAAFEVADRADAGGGAGSPPAATTDAPSAAASASEAKATGDAARASTGRRARRVLASPATRKLAVSLGVDIASIPGTGPGGRVTREDVERAAQRQPSQAVSAPAVAAQPVAEAVRQRPGDEEVPLRGIRRQVARTMTRSWTEIPHITEFREVDATQLIAAREALRRRAGDAGRAMTFLPFFVLACTAALKRHRILNASLDIARETIIYRGAIHIGIATATDDGLIVPVLHDADRLSLREINQRIADLAEAARARRLRPDQLDGATFTISNFGSYGTWLGTPIINPPQAAIAGFGRIEDRVVAVAGQPVVRPTLPIAVSADHRLIDGHVLGAFVNELAALLENPIVLLGEVR